MISLQHFLELSMNMVEDTGETVQKATRYTNHATHGQLLEETFEDEYWGPEINELKVMPATIS